MLKDTSVPAAPGEVKENDTTKDAPLPKHTGKGMSAVQGFDLPPGKTELLVEDQPDSFEITDWSGYPDGPKPEGPFRILEGEEYKNARAFADQTNRDLHKDTPGLKGLNIHEVHPVKFGGSPTDLDNKIFLTPQEHARYTTWWNNLLKSRAVG